MNCSQSDLGKDEPLTILVINAGSSSMKFGLFDFDTLDPVATGMLDWAGHESESVRRLASEGCRPRLPWAMALPAFKADPAPILPILEKLKLDPSESVRRSVANNLNDIANAL